VRKTPHLDDRSGDLLHAEIVDALALPGCPVCAALRTHERRYIARFWEAARADADLRHRFAMGGGLCRDHAWALHDHHAVREPAGVIGSLYAPLLRRELAGADELLARLARGGGLRRREARRFTRKGSCLACEELDRASARKAGALAEALLDAPVQRRFARSDGPCAPHLALLVDESRHVAPGVTRLLLLDWRRRLAALLGEEDPPDVRGRSGGQVPSLAVLRGYVGRRASEASGRAEP
jgi:hypothetical protein